MKVFPKRWSLLFGIIALQTTASFAQSGWTRQESGTTYTLNSVSFVDANTGTAVGGHGTILRTTDGGDTWTQQESGTTAILYGVSFADADRGIAVGYRTTVRTDDGGATWIPQTVDAWLAAVAMADRDRAIAVGNGVILRKARHHGLSAPISEVVVPLLAAASDGPG